MAHVPVPQVALALVRAQAVPHEPQLVVVLRAVSQPLASAPSQLPKPLEHDAIAQTPPAQVAPALLREQLVPQAPQFVSVSRRASQPFSSMPSQFP